MKKEWYVECPKCGKSKPAAELGIIRRGAVSIGKRILGYCTTCKRYRMAKMIKKNSP